jgi:hypothetical protein
MMLRGLCPNPHVSLRESDRLAGVEPRTWFAQKPQVLKDKDVARARQYVSARTCRLPENDWRARPHTTKE